MLGQSASGVLAERRGRTLQVTLQDDRAGRDRHGTVVLLGRRTRLGRDAQGKRSASAEFGVDRD